MKNEQKIMEVHWQSGRITQSKPMTEAELKPIKAAYNKMVAAGTVKMYVLRNPAEVYARPHVGGRHG